MHSGIHHDHTHATVMLRCVFMSPDQMNKERNEGLMNDRRKIQLY